MKRMRRALRTFCAKKAQRGDEDVWQQKLGPVRRDNVVDDKADDFRKDEAGERAQRRAHKRGDAKERVRAGIDPDATEGFHSEFRTEDTELTEKRQRRS